MGSSRFAKGNRYGYFPTVGLAWIASEEKFLKDKEWLDFLKIKASTGLLGTDNYFDFSYLSLVGILTKARILVPN